MSQSINNLNRGTPSTAAVIPFYDPTQGQDYGASFAQFMALLGSAGSVTTQYAAPNASGFVVLVNPAASGGNVWLLITPNAGYAALTIDLPAGVDQQELVVNCTQAVTTLTVTGATVGASAQPVNGAPTSLSANGHFRLKFDGVLGAWFAI